MSARRNRPPSGRSNLFKSQSDVVIPKKNRPTSACPLPTKNSVISSSFDGSWSSGRPMSARTNSSRMSSPINQSSSRASSSRRPQSASPISKSRPDSSRKRVPPPRNSTLFTSSSRTDGICSARPTPKEEDDGPDISEYRFLPAEEIIARMKEELAREERAQISRDTMLLSKYNAFSRPKRSKNYPLRTALLDPEVNNIPPSRTRSELMKKIKLSAMPHPSFDIDGDGWVSQEDYRTSKRFDFDGNGVIDPRERDIAKHTIAEEFFTAHKGNLQVFGDKIASASHEENVDKLEHSASFERIYNRLRSVEDNLKGSSSKVMVACMHSSTPRLTKKNFYTNQYDTTAYNTFDAMPYDRESSSESHCGSQRSLMLQRKEEMRREASRQFDRVVADRPMFRAVKVNLISNPAMEN